MNVSNLLANLGALRSFGGVVLAIVILLAMITIHEFGHYVAGKILGFKINEFSIGFGPALFKKRSKKTGELFALRIIPLGGYCAFDGEDEFEDEPPKNPDEEPFEEMQTAADVSQASEKSEENSVDKDEEYPEPKGARFNDQAPWKRIIVLIAGALMNYLLALTLIVVMFAGFGRPVYMVEKQEPIKEASQEAWDIYNSGLQTGDIILEINGKDLYLVTDYMSVLDGKRKGDVVGVLVVREGKKQVVDVTLVKDSNPKNMSDIGSILYPLGLAYREDVAGEDGEIVNKLTFGGGLVPTDVKSGFFGTIGHSFVYSFKIGGTILRSLGELLTGKLGINAVGGPATTIKLTSEVAASGLQNFLSIAAFIGVNLAVFNLLPVPALDGCKVIFCIIEWIRKKPVNRKVEAIINFAGLIFLFGFAILVDLLQFIG
ncbi:MAG: site-2 protease family protein [Clostridia bacterium]|nr:site-2 protease family protein [Clostridia bacterium]